MTSQFTKDRSLFKTVAIIADLQGRKDSVKSLLILLETITGRWKTFETRTMVLIFQRDTLSILNGGSSGVSMLGFISLKSLMKKKTRILSFTQVLELLTIKIF